MKWPVTVEGTIKPSRGKINQYEIHCNHAEVNIKLPLASGNPYVQTVGTGKGITITCKYKDNSELGQFHRGEHHTWIYNNFEQQSRVATRNWKIFILLFEIKVGMDIKQVPVLLEFHEDLTIIIH
jgi:hypothetical protein